MFFFFEMVWHSYVVQNVFEPSSLNTPTQFVNCIIKKKQICKPVHFGSN